MEDGAYCRCPRNAARGASKLSSLCQRSGLQDQQSSEQCAKTDNCSFSPDYAVEFNRQHIRDELHAFTLVYPSTLKVWHVQHHAVLLFLALCLNIRTVFKIAIVFGNPDHFDLTLPVKVTQRLNA